MLTDAEVKDLLLVEWEARQRRKLREEAPKYDWYGPPCGCPETREDGSCPVHRRARPNQRPPEDPDWLVWACVAGRGWGKTKTGAQWVVHQAQHGPTNARIALVGKNSEDVREVMILGESGILACSPPDFRPKHNKTHGTLKWPNGAQAFSFSSEEPDSLRGPQFHDAWCDEFAKWSYIEECWSNLRLALRLGVNEGHTPRTLLTTTPLPIPILKRILADVFRTRVSTGSTFDNASNLAGSYIEDVRRRLDGTRLGQQEVYGRILEDTPGALWKSEQIDRHRVKEHPDLVRVVVAVDPSASDAKPKAQDEEKRAEAGIVVAGTAEVDGVDHYFVLEDLSLAASPKGWGEAAVGAYHARMADRLVAETNNGGAMVEAVIRSIDPDVSYKQLWASRGKQTRAEPVAALYENGRVHHVGHFAELEAQLTTWVPGMKSPDRMDALVWAITELQDTAPAFMADHPFKNFRG